MSKKLYRPKRKKSKEKLSFMDKLEMGSIVIAAAALIGWSGWSAMDALIPDPPVPTYSLYMDGITAFLMTTQGVEPDDQETDVETEGEDATPEPTVTPKPTVTQKPAVTPEPTATPKPKKKKKKSKPIYAGNESSKAGELSTPTETPKTYFATTAVKVRQEPTSESLALAMYMPDVEINVIPDDMAHEGWLKVNKDGVIGYVSEKHVEKR